MNFFGVVPISCIERASERDSPMRRFFFDLQGGQNIDDRLGLMFESELAAFRSAERMAHDLASARPGLHGNTCVVVKRDPADDGFYISV